MNRNTYGLLLLSILWGSIIGAPEANPRARAFSSHVIRDTPIRLLQSLPMRPINSGIRPIQVHNPFSDSVQAYALRVELPETEVTVAPMGTAQHINNGHRLNDRLSTVGALGMRWIGLNPLFDVATYSLWFVARQRAKEFERLYPLIEGQTCHYSNDIPDANVRTLFQSLSSYLSAIVRENPVVRHVPPRQQPSRPEDFEYILRARQPRQQ